MGDKQRYTGPESIEQLREGVLNVLEVRLDDGGKLKFKAEDGYFRLYIISPRGAELKAALFTAERLRNVGAALVAFASGELREPTRDLPSEAGEDRRFSLLDVD